MQKIICDRCGQDIQMNIDKKLNLMVEIHEKLIFEHVDLCSKCTEDFKAFMKVVKE